MRELPPEALEHIAAYFQALSEPTRLQLINLLRGGERNVGELARACGCTTANASKHLALLAQQGMVARESRGTSVYYRIADATIDALCDLVCDTLARQFEQRAQDSALFGRADAAGVPVRPVPGAA